MRKRIILPLCLLLCLWTASAFAQGILPVLQTPMPEITQAVSLHAMKCTDAPVPKTDGKGGYTFEYSGVTFSQYEFFGRALGQDGFVLESSETGGNGEIISAVTRGWARITVTYNPDSKKMRVAYPPRVEAMETDPDHPVRVDADLVSILPAVPQAVSLKSISGWYPDGRMKAEGDRRDCYSAVSYDGYTLLSEALGQEGYSLVSAETLEDGTSRAVVTDGSVSLTIDYNLDTQEASVLYPENTFPRDIDYFGGFSEVKTGQPVPLTDGVTATFLGWETTENWYSYWRNTNWIPTKTGYDDHPAQEGFTSVWLEIRIDYNRPEEKKILDLLQYEEAYDEWRPVEFSLGERSGSYRLNGTSTAARMSGQKSGVLAVAMTLRDSQAARLDDIRFTFSSTDYLRRYAFRLTEDNRKPAEEAQ